ncbi:UDP-N-acetylmuramate dehydrogenase [Phycisphaera mikurensis]|uniref:UDP-N-acetylenolpyruvoylglucosamine reductase n=1 Tax=Phycisphaera mikurensis (strain NBRC 102666 / KCTC 22515 / FYK2301M01) TaxID=1142394 RepID=I0IC90_PHYMF|nr:UDP-N-acetylmuramate dehydrogenase [Phycisphaera mikurensis]MBB6441903.1 UDP-N-acetylmuramate dehydrogenase [Phycisphaera mikurensis]BAM02878.1 UDP-N-acetylenolpyruvoylglucosamine reductase [Phycisphaera mikurensis NBRC 102666]
MLGDLIAAGIPAEADAPLGARTWYRCGGRAELLVKPRTVDEAAEIRRRSADSGTPFRVLGGGANLLVPEGVVPGITARLAGPAFEGVRLEAQRLEAGAGVDLYALVTAATRAGLAGLARVAGVPGTVGGGIAMNAGGAHGALGDRLASATLLDAAGRLERVPPSALRLGYRTSELGGRLVVAAAFLLEPEDPASIRARVRERLALKKAEQPLAAKSAGCAFRNPSGASASVGDPQDPGSWAAGKLIDAAGCKGLRIGSARVSERHANFVTVDAGGRAADVLAVMDEAARRVADRFGVALEREVAVWTTRPSP